MILNKPEKRPDVHPKISSKEKSNCTKRTLEATPHNLPRE